jgi:hypothetical protein
VFRELDTDRDGLVSAAEFHTALYRLRVDIPQKEVEACVEACAIPERPGYVDYVGLAMCVSRYKCWILSVKQVTQCRHPPPPAGVSRHGLRR